MDAARDLISRHDPGAIVAHRLEVVEAALEQATADRLRLGEAVARLEPERVARELKEALRSRRDPAAPDTPAIETLRRRYESVHALRNRIDDLDTTIETTVADLETCAAAVVEASFRSSVDDGTLSGQLDALTADAEALAAAHDELAAL